MNSSSLRRLSCALYLFYIESMRQSANSPATLMTSKARAKPQHMIILYIFFRTARRDRRATAHDKRQASKVRRKATASIHMARDFANGFHGLLICAHDCLDIFDYILLTYFTHVLLPTARQPRRGRHFSLASDATLLIMAHRLFLTRL